MFTTFPTLTLGESLGESPPLPPGLLGQARGESDVQRLGALESVEFRSGEVKIWWWINLVV